MISWLGRLLGALEARVERVEQVERGGRGSSDDRTLVVGTLAAAKDIPLETPLDRIGPRRGAVTACGSCGDPVREVVVTTFGAPAVWRAYPLAVDGWRCASCGELTIPRFLERDEATALERDGLAHLEAGRLDQAELALRRLCNGWPAYAPGHVHLAAVYRARIDAATDDDPALHATMEAQLRAALAGDGLPLAPRVIALVRALCGREAIAEANHAIDVARARPDLTDDDRAALANLARTVATRGDLYERGLAIVQPLLDAPPTAPLDARARTRLTRAASDLVRYANTNPTAWRPRWYAAQAYRLLGDDDASDRELAAARRLAPDV